MNISTASLLARYAFDRTRVLDMFWEIQDSYGHLPDDAIAELAEGLDTTALDIRETASFFHFFHLRPAGRYRIYLSDNVIAKMHGFDDVRGALERETGARFGGTDPSNTFGLYETSCIGLSDQEPAMMLDKVVFTRLTPEKVADIVAKLRDGLSPEQIANPHGLDPTEIAYVDSLVASNIRRCGPAFFQGDIDMTALLRNCLQRRPEEVIVVATDSRLRGRGGAGFSAGLKWRLCREAPGETAYVICNADEGEPGTFKDRVLLTRSPKEVFLGMVIAAYAVGSPHGLVYLRAEYVYLKAYLEAQLQEMRDQNLLGRDILGQGFDFDIRIQLGAGAYICGDESALIESCEGKRGTPRLKPPFPVHAGFLGQPTSVHNVETFAAVTRLLYQGSGWYEALGTSESAGTRLLSVSGDCERPGIYEVEFGITLNHVIDLVGARNAWAAQVSGPSGEFVSVDKDGERRISYDDLSCNGSLMIFDRTRDTLGIVRDFMRFFVAESCGICTPCRSGNVDLLNAVNKIIEGRGVEQDLEDLVAWGEMIMHTSRCGLGGTSPKPVLTSLRSFPEVYRQKIVDHAEALLPTFSREAALSDHDQAHAAIAAEDAT